MYRMQYYLEAWIACSTIFSGMNRMQYYIAVCIACNTIFSGLNRLQDKIFDEKFSLLLIYTVNTQLWLVYYNISDHMRNFPNTLGLYISNTPYIAYIHTLQMENIKQTYKPSFETGHPPTASQSKNKYYAETRLTSPRKSSSTDGQTIR